MKTSLQPYCLWISLLYLTLSSQPPQALFSAFYPGDLESTHIQVVMGYLRGMIQNGAFFFSLIPFLAISVSSDYGEHCKSL